MAIADDFSVDVLGNIRYVGTTPNYTVIELHRYLGDLMDDAQAGGNDLIDITDATASERATDNLITLNSPYNIDDIAAQHLYDGSIVQTGGDDIYDGIVVFAPAGTPLQIHQNGKPTSPNFWDTALNADATNGISHRFMVKTRTAAVDIDLRKVRGTTRDIGFTYSSFTINSTSRGNNVLALTYAADLNNGTAEATIRGWTTITNTEGYRLLDVDNDTVDEPYYSEWNRAALTINQLYERTKWLSRESTAEQTGTDTGIDFQLANATITGQAQSFANGVNNQFITRIRVRMKKTGSPTGNITPTIKAHSGSFGTTSIPTGAALATGTLFDIATLTTVYKTYELEFPTPFEAVASTNYTLTLEAAVIDGSNFVSVEGQTTGTSAGNRSQEVAATWTDTGADDLNHIVFASAVLYAIPGERFRGVTHELDVNTPTGSFAAVEPVSWTGGTGQMLAIDSVTAGTQMWIQLLTGIPPSGTDLISAPGSGATVNLNTTLTARTISEPFIGASTGSALIGAYGIGVETADLTVADSLTDLDDTVNGPPNNVTFSVGGVVIGEDRILVAPLGFEFAFDGELTGPFTLGETLTFTGPAGTAYLSELRDNADDTGRMKVRMLTGDPPINNSTISGGISGATGAAFGTSVPSEDPRQLRLNTTLSGVAETALVTVSAIPTDTPGSGTVRVQMNSQITRFLTYDSYTGSTFTLGIASTNNIQLDVVAAAGTITRVDAGSFVADGFIEGMSFTGSDFLNAGNNAQFTVATVTALVITVVNNAGMVNETGTGDEDVISDGHDFVPDNATGGASEAGNSVYVSYLDLLATATTESFTSVYSGADRSLFIRARDGGTAGDTIPIKTFETTGILGSAGGSATAIRTSDA